MTRSRRALLALLLAVPAALGVALVVAAATHLVDGRAGRGAALAVIGVLLLLGAMRALRAINARNEEV